MKSQGTADYNSLNWVKKQLDTVLHESQTALSEYIEDSSEDAQMQECIDGLRLVYGTLQMVEIYGASMLAEEMEKTATAALENRIDNKDDAYDVLMRAMLQLPDYLEGLQAGNRDSPVALMPLMNDLRAVRKDKLLSENILFFPDVEAVDAAEAEVAVEVEEGKLEKEARRLRAHFQLGLLDVLKKDRHQPGCQRMLAVIHALEKATSDPAVRRLWSVIGALLEAIYERGIDVNVSIKTLLGTVDRQIKLLVDVGEVEFADRFSQELLKNILYYVGHSTSRGARVSRIREKYRLDELMSTADKEEEGASGVGGLNAELFQTVSQGIKEDLAQVKDALEIFVHGNEKDISSLETIADQLGRIGDTYGMLGLGSTRQTVLDQRDRVAGIAGGGVEADEDTIMAIAGELLGAESDLENYIAKRAGAAGIEFDDEERIVPVAEYREVLSTVIRQGLDNFTEAKEAILSFTSGAEDEGQLTRVLQLLEEVRGVSLMLPMTQVESLIVKLMDYVRIALIEHAHRPQSEEQDTVADVVTAIEYYLEAVTEGRPGVEQGLRTGEVAADRLEQVCRQYSPVTEDAAPAAESGAGEGPLESVEPEAGEVGAETAATQESDGLPDTQTAGADTEVAAEEVPTVISSIDSERQSGEFEILGDDVDEEILEIFIEEALEVLDELHANLPSWKSNFNDEEALAIVRRSFHTLKGSGRLIGAEMIGEFSWKFENMLNRVIDSKIEPDENVLNTLDEAVNVLPQLIEQLTGNREPVPNVYELMAVADALSEGRSPDDVIARGTGEAKETGTEPSAQLTASEAATGEEEFAEDEALSAEPPSTVDAQQEKGETESSYPMPAEESVEDLSQAAPAGASAQAGAVPDDETVEVSLSETDSPTEEASAEEHADRTSPAAEQEERSALESTAEADDIVANARPELHLVEGGAAEETAAFDAEEEIEQLDTQQSAATDEDWDAEWDVEAAGDSAEAESDTTPEIEDEDAEAFELNMEDLSADREETVPHSTDVEAEEIAPGAGMDPVLFRIYYDESINHLANVNAVLDEHTAAGVPVQADKDMVRAFHTLFGSARTAEIEDIADICGATEKYLKVRQEGASTDVPEDVVNVIKQISVHVRDMLDTLKKGEHPHLDRSLHDRISAAIKSELQEQLQSTSQSEADDEQMQFDDAEAEFTESEDFRAEAAEEPEQEQEQEQESAADAEAEADTTVISYADIDEDLIDIFLEEAEELLESCEEMLLKITAEPDDTDNIRQLQRYMHTLKGGARMAELAPVGDLTHDLESLVIKVADHAVSADKQLFATLNDAIDRLAAMLKDVKNRAPITSAKGLMENIERLMNGERLEQRSVERFDVDLDDLESAEADMPGTGESGKPEPVREAAPAPAEGPEEKHVANVVETPARRSVDRGDQPHWGERATDVNFRESQEQIRVRADLLNNLVNSAGEVNIYHARMVKQMSDIAFNLGELDATVVRLKQQLRNLDIETEIQIRSTYEKENDQYDEDFDPLEMDRYSTMQQLSRSLSETASDVESIRSILGDIVRDSETLLLQESRVSIELQEGLMRTRMVRFGGLGTRLRRIVRQTARELHKEVELELVGDSNELDRTVLDRIIAPLEHMLRNAVAHGIESPEERVGSGKDETGKIVISVDRQGADVVIRVRDDGRGVDADAIRDKAIRQGLLEENNKLTDHDVLQFILKSGFSTADEVTQVSGRGVGMDVVDTELKQLGGLLEINTWKGEGTEFTVRLPLTLAINQALLVTAVDDVYAIPLASIEGVVRVTGAELQQFYDSEQKLYEFNNVEYELKHLGKLLTGYQPDYREQYNLFPVLLTQVGDQHYALHVDDMVGRREIVVKPVGHQISSVRGIAGATILADGRVVLIIEMSALVVGDSLFVEPEEETEVPAEVVPTPQAEKHRTIMVVDDSITIRKVTARMLERNGISVLLAKDGVDATSQLVDHIPDLMLLDIEMPRMDGFELATYIRNDDRLKDIPIIMITSRTGSKHKEKALEIGVNQYLGKPYQEEELMKNINELL